MTFRRIAIPFLCLFGACTGGTFEKVPGQDLAEKAVWHDLYGEDGPAPPVEWFHTESGMLPGSTGAHGLTLPGWKIQAGVVPTMCPDNLYHPGPGFECSLSGSSYAHELMHYHSFLTTGDVDAAHARSDWYLADKVAFQALIDLRL